MQDTSAEIVNRVALSGLITFDLEEYYHPAERVVYDLKQNLFMELILKEKDFREFLKNHDWEAYRGKNVAVICSADAIVPMWAYMLLMLHLSPVANCVVLGNLATLEETLYRTALDKIDFATFTDKRVVVKGCSKVDVPAAVYADLTKRLQPYVKSLLFGEPCSTVPLFKRK